MPFVIPEMPLIAGIWSVSETGTVTFRVEAPCNVAFGKRVTTAPFPSGPAASWGAAYLLFPAGTDVRDEFSQGAGMGDAIEVPSGSHRWYTAQLVNDSGQGFPNEHRVAICMKNIVIELWPAPLPPVWEGPPLVVRRLGDRLEPRLAREVGRGGRARVGGGSFVSPLTS
jgi:hypothetical protein